jgi:hypothetical protein
MGLGVAPPFQCVRCGHFGPVTPVAYLGPASWSALAVGLSVGLCALAVAALEGSFGVLSFSAFCTFTALAIAMRVRRVRGKCARCNGDLGRIDE